MKIGYLLNTYPMTTTTFIRREIHALEDQGVEIVRYAIRPWGGSLVDEHDRRESALVRYILTGRPAALIGSVFVEFASNPVGVARSLAMSLKLSWNAGGRLVRNLAYFVEAVSLKRWAGEDGIEHLHTHFSTNAAAVALLSQRLGGPSYSFTAHGPNEFDDSAASSVAEKVAGARFAVAISNYCRVQLARATGMAAWSKLHVVRCGVNAGEYAASGVPFEDNATFVCVGRLCVEKAQTLIVEAASEVARTQPKLKVILIGDGEGRADVEAAIVKHRMQDHVVLMGWKSNDEVRRILGQARALLLPSFAEGLPIVIMEALALERPVITTYIAGIPELIDDTCGWIVPAGSVDSIAQAMTAALATSPAELARMGREGRRRVVALHNTAQNASELRGLFSEACRKPQAVNLPTEPACVGIAG